MNTLNENDPRLTAYALGELDASEIAEIEAMLRGDTRLRDAIDDIRQTASLVSAGLAAEPSVTLTERQRQSIQSRPVHVEPKPFLLRARSLWAGVGLAAAACIVVALYVVSQSGGGASNGPVARNDEISKERAAADVLGQGGKSAGKDEVAQGSAFSNPAPAGAHGGVGGPGTTGAAATSPRDFASLSAAAVPAEKAEHVAPTAKPASPPPPPPPPLPSLYVGAGADPRGGGAAHEMSKRVNPGTAPGSAGEPRSAARPADSPARERKPGALREIAADGEQRDAGRIKDDLGAEEFRHLVDNPFLSPLDHPNPTFSVDVDTASYSNIRRFLNDGSLPPPDAVRIEEMINYFPYAYEPPSGDVPFSANVEISAAPWNPEHRLVRIGLKGREVKMDMRPATSIVFLLDVSGSMNQANKLPLVKESMKLLVNKLNGDDRLAIVTYAGDTRVLMDSTFCSDERKPAILAAIDGLHSGGSTNGSSGIQLAYDTAASNFIKGGVNRVILCTDGDFNVGVTGGPLTRMIEEKRDTGVFLSVLGFGTGNLKDGTMEELANHGNGNFAYIDRIEEAKKVLVDQMGGTLVTIAKDVKVLFDFNPAKVGAYRLIGYEDRLLAAEDFANDRKDAGEIGAGHTVTALFEIIPPGVPASMPEAPQSDFIEKGKLVESELLGNLKLRYKQPDGDASKELIFSVKDDGQGLDRASNEFKFVAAVAQLGMILRQTPAELRGNASIASVLDLAAAAKGPDPDGYRAEFIGMAQKVRQLMGDAVE